MNDAAPAITLAICSYNGAKRLPACLDAVAALRCGQPWEVVLVDNASTDATAQIMQDFAASAPVPVRYVCETRRGLGAARVAALAAARGDIVACTDDDCYAEPDFLDAALKAFADPRIGYISGRILLFDPTDAPVTIQTATEPKRFPAGEATGVGEIQGASLAFRREAAIAAGGFDPMLGAGTPFPSEDFDFSLRMSAAGWDGAYVPELVVHHHHGRKADAAAHLYRGYRIGAAAVYVKALLDLPGLRRKVLVAWAKQQRWMLRTAPKHAFYEHLGAVQYAFARLRRRFARSA